MPIKLLSKRSNVPDLEHPSCGVFSAAAPVATDLKALCWPPLVVRCDSLCIYREWGSFAATELLPLRLFGRNRSGILGGNGPGRMGEVEDARDSVSESADRRESMMGAGGGRTRTASVEAALQVVGAVQTAVGAWW